MPLPAELNHAVAAQGGGRLALILGAGCSVELPTGVPVARVCSQAIHDELVADGFLTLGECNKPDDLSVLADLVFQKAGTQEPLVTRLRQRYQLHAKMPNEGYLIVAALLAERAIASVVTLNYDVSMTTAVATLACGDSVGIIEGPHHLGNQTNHNVYYLHRSANEADPNAWVLRTQTIQAEWQGNWEQQITQHVLVRPVVVFAGIGTAVTVLLESARLMRQAIPAATRQYQVNPSPSAVSGFFQQMQLAQDRYIQMGWCEFMRQLADRLVVEHHQLITTSAQEKAQENNFTNEDLTSLLAQLRSHGVVTAGRIRANWLLNDKRSYQPMDVNISPLQADLLLGIAYIARYSTTEANVAEDGLVEFRRGGKVISAVIVASGSGHRKTASIETRVNQRRAQWRTRGIQPTATLLAATSDGLVTITPPADLVRGEDPAHDIIAGPSALSYHHLEMLRATPSQIVAIVP